MSAWRTGGWPSPELNPGARGDECPVQPFDSEHPMGIYHAPQKANPGYFRTGPGRDSYAENCIRVSDDLSNLVREDLLPIAIE